MLSQNLKVQTKVHVFAALYTFDPAGFAFALQLCNIDWHVYPLSYMAYPIKRHRGLETILADFGREAGLHHGQVASSSCISYANISGGMSCTLLE